MGVNQGQKIPVEVIRAITGESHKRGKLVLAHPSIADGLQARFGRANEVGTFAPGMNADIAVLAGDPAHDVQAFSRVRMTLRNGKIIYRASQR